MPRGLAIETSGRTGSVALAVDGAVVARDDFPHGLRHSAEMLPRIDALCRARGWSPADIGEVYLSVGPGSFTGLRIGVTLAKTLAMATGARLAAVPSVDVLARNAPPGAAHVVVALDARRGHVFAARFAVSSDGHWRTEEPGGLDVLPAVLSRCPRPVHVVGDGIAANPAAVAPDDPGVVLTPPDAWRPRVEVVAELGYTRARDGLLADPDGVVPTYMRRPEAEEKWDERARGESQG
jgi:tRNA threonylcarbamoyladenosine biosynthesis protein TsaB